MKGGNSAVLGGRGHVAPANARPTFLGSRSGGAQSDLRGLENLEFAVSTPPWGNSPGRFFF